MFNFDLNLFTQKLSDYYEPGIILDSWYIAVNTRNENPFSNGAAIPVGETN